MHLPDGVRITTDMLWRGAALFALLDAAVLGLALRRVPAASFRRAERLLPAVTALAWAGIWLWAVAVFWDRVYTWVFPSWSRWLLPPFMGSLTAAAAYAAARATHLAHRRPAVVWALLGGVWGVLTHTWAVHRGIVSRPPLLAGASPVAAVTVAFFEFTFYWAVVAVTCLAVVRFGTRRRHRPAAGLRLSG
jgi:hypothetical protein